MKRFEIVFLVFVFTLIAVWTYVFVIAVKPRQSALLLPNFLETVSLPFSGFENIRQTFSPQPIFLPPLTLDAVFAEDHGWVATLSAEKRVMLIATGDVISARSVNYQTIKRGDFRWPFAKTADVLSAADITLINLETPLLRQCPIRNDGMIFCGDARHVEGLTFAGVDVASIANNHAGNWSKEGVEETSRHLADADIQVSGGDDQPVYKEVKEIRFAFLAYNDIDHEEEGISWAHNEKVASQIREARKNADIVIVSFHWGPEYTRQPHPREVELAHLAIDSGADLIIGNHPHWIQPVELYKGKFIMYAHGNFVFDQEWSEETKLGVVGRYTFYDKQLVDVEYLPVRIIDYGQPYFLEGDVKQSQLDMLRQASRVTP